jgi:hypothetical protein
MRAGLREERLVAKLLHGQVEECEQQADEDVRAERAKHRLGRDAAVVQNSTDRHR